MFLRFFLQWLFQKWVIGNSSFRVFLGSRWGMSSNATKAVIWAASWNRVLKLYLPEIQFPASSDEAKGSLTEGYCKGHQWKNLYLIAYLILILHTFPLSWETRQGHKAASTSIQHHGRRCGQCEKASRLEEVKLALFTGDMILYRNSHGIGECICLFSKVAGYKLSIQKSVFLYINKN